VIVSLAENVDREAGPVSNCRSAWAAYGAARTARIAEVAWIRQPYQTTLTAFVRAGLDGCYYRGWSVGELW